jgi:hypothetical protein
VKFCRYRLNEYVVCKIVSRLSTSVCRSAEYYSVFNHKVLRQANSTQDFLNLPSTNFSVSVVPIFEMLLKSTYDFISDLRL